jgi:hypothetical protein
LADRETHERARVAVAQWRASKPSPSFLARTEQRDLTTVTAPALLGMRTYGRSDLMTWSAVVRAGAQVVTDLKGKVTFWQISTCLNRSGIPKPGCSFRVTRLIWKDPLSTPGFQEEPTQEPKSIYLGKFDLNGYSFRAYERETDKAGRQFRLISFPSLTPEREAAFIRYMVNEGLIENI